MFTPRANAINTPEAMRLQQEQRDLRGLLAELHAWALATTETYGRDLESGDLFERIRTKLEQESV